MHKGRKMIRECVECQHKQIGYSDRDGDACEKCGVYADPKGWSMSNEEVKTAIELFMS